MSARANKIMLLIVSLATLSLLVTAAVRETWFQEWRVIQRKYRASLPRETASGFRIQLRQIVAPSLRVADRCVTCHLGMAPGEVGISGSRVFGKHPKVHHDPSEIGCTICHGGQGRATESRAAHGTVLFWPEPMIPAGSSYASCGSCHIQLAVPGITLLDQGRAAFEQSDCLACHRLEGRGGTIRPGGAGGMEGPDLSQAGAAGFNPSWYESHLRKAADPALGPFRNSFRAIRQEARLGLDLFLASRVGAPGLVESKALFHSLGCMGCHKVAGIGGDEGPDLTKVGNLDPGRLDFSHVPGERSLAGYLKEHFRAPAKVVPGSLMPEMGLTERQIEGLAFHMLSLRRAEVPEAFWPKDRIRAQRFGEREFASDGATLYGTFCAACHGEEGLGRRFAGTSPMPAIASRDFLALASDSFLVKTIKYGRPGRRMPAWGGAGGTLTDADIGRVAAHVRSMSGGIPAEEEIMPRRWVVADARNGAEQYAANCARCHGAAGEGGEGVALRNPVLLSSASDRYLVETIRRGRAGTAMRGFQTSTSVSRALSEPEIEAIVAFIRSWEVIP